MDLNNVSFTGRLTKDAIMKVAGSYDLCEFTIASNGVKQEDTLFLKVNLWGKGSKGIQPYLTKGKQVGVTGTLKKNVWVNKDGNEVQDYSVNCNNVTLLGNKEPEKSADEEDIPF